jgi:phosphoesterase RecJ-like protein
LNNLDALLKKSNTIGITGHVNPDGDCIGACLGLYGYIKNLAPDKQVDVYLESLDPVFKLLKGNEVVQFKPKENVSYDLFIILDCSDLERTGSQAVFYHNAKQTLNIDHHVSNRGFCDTTFLQADASSTCEVLYDLMDERYIDDIVAAALYTGIVHDTGMFRHTCTSPKTMKIAGALLTYGIDFNRIINETFMQKTYVQNQVLGRALLESILLLDGTCIASVFSRAEMDFYGVTPQDLNGIIDQLKLTTGISCAIFLYEKNNLEYKVSMRTDDPLDAAKIAVSFGGGGHKNAAGCTMQGTKYDILNNIVKEIMKQQAAQ